MNDDKVKQSENNSDLSQFEDQINSWLGSIQEDSEGELKNFIQNGIVYILLDCSGSMADYSKIDHAKRGALNYASQAIKEDYSIGLISFASKALLILEATSDLEQFKSSVSTISIGGSTNLYDAIVLGTQKLSNYSFNQILCVVTDGMPDDESQVLRVADKAKEIGIEIMTIGTDDADKKFLDKLASNRGFSIMVSRDLLQSAITSMSKLLPRC